MQQTNDGKAAAAALRRRVSTAFRTRNEDQWLERLELNRGRLAELSRRLQERAWAVERVDVAPEEGPRSTADLGDQALLVRERTAREAMLQVLSENGEQIERALQRLAQGTYGSCEDCGAAIPAERLEFKPEATRCVSCQEAHDRWGATGG
jgi:RNA polymerase-binding transcription factor DksA